MLLATDLVLSSERILANLRPINKREEEEKRRRGKIWTELRLRDGKIKDGQQQQLW